MAFVSVENLNQIVGSKPILKAVSCKAYCKNIVAFLGPNGAGKTTLLKTIMGLLPTPAANPMINENCIYLEEQLINNWPVHKRVASGLVYVPQQTSLFQQMSVKENLALVYEYHPTWQKQQYKQFWNEATSWLERATLPGILEQQAQTLSGGQKRKLEVIRALLMHPKGIMLDEPFAGVDPKSIYELKKIFVDIAGTGIAVIISDHHVDQLLSIATYVYVVLNGHIVCSGTTKEILENKLTKDNYLGNQFYEEMAQRFLHEQA